MLETNVPKISIIVPVYNTEKYLIKCIQSILFQSFTDFELLLINDGSNDNSGAICDQYAANDTRVRVFHKENGGVSSARNVGLENAKGEWITFVDSDDWLGHNYLRSLIAHSNADMVMTSFNCVGKTEDWDNSISDRFYGKDEIKFFLERYIHTVALCGSCCKLFKKLFVGSLRFNNNISSKEDTIFVFEYLSKISTICTVQSWEYQYRRGLNNSLSVRELPIDQYVDIMVEYSNSFRHLENVFGFDGRMARVINNSSTLNRCLHVIKDSDEPLWYRYKKFVKLLTEENIREAISFKDKRIKGLRRLFFDTFAKFRIYPILFGYVIICRGSYIY